MHILGTHATLPPAPHACTPPCMHACMHRFTYSLARREAHTQLSLFLPPCIHAEGEGPQWRMCGSLRGHNGDVQDLAWSPDASALVSGSVENLCILWDVESRRGQVSTSRPWNGMEWNGWRRCLACIYCRPASGFDPVIGRYYISSMETKCAEMYMYSLV